MAKQMTADEESILKRQARRRLIGAIALTTVVVIVLPIVFDGEPPSTKVSDIELRIPDKDKVGDLQAKAPVAAISAASAVVPSSATVSAPAPVAVPVEASAVVPAVAAPVVATVAPHSQQAKAEPAKPEAAKPTQPENKSEVKQKIETKPVAANAVPHAGFVVQVGAFANAGAAKKLQDKLLAQGLQAYSEKVGHNVRVRVGSFSTHEAADKVRHKLEAQGLHPNIVNLGR